MEGCDVLTCSSSSLDGLLRQVFERLLLEGSLVRAHQGEFTEAFGACLHLSDPLARLSRSEVKGKVYSALGEFLWYLSGDTRLQFIDYYIPGRLQKESDDGVRVRSGYGERLLSWRGVNQLENVINLLKVSRTSRRAVVQLFDASDITQRFASVPCTCSLQFLARDGRLHMFVTMRSNDAFLGLPHDVFSFTMLQELVARSLDLELGEYKHCVGSLHLYQDHFEAAKHYLEEGWQDPVCMPSMPTGDPWGSVNWLRTIEGRIRDTREPEPDIEAADVDEYWKDVARLLLALRASKEGNATRLAELKERLHCDAYRTFVMARLDRAGESQRGGSA